MVRIRNVPPMEDIQRQANTDTDCLPLHHVPCSGILSDGWPSRSEDRANSCSFGILLSYVATMSEKVLLHLTSLVFLIGGESVALAVAAFSQTMRSNGAQKIYRNNSTALHWLKPHTRVTIMSHVSAFALRCIILLCRVTLVEPMLDRQPTPKGDCFLRATRLDAQPALRDESITHLSVASIIFAASRLSASFFAHSPHLPFTALLAPGVRNMTIAHPRLQRSSPIKFLVIVFPQMSHSVIV